MDYLTAHYKKLCEDLQRRINILEQTPGAPFGQPKRKPRRGYSQGDSRLDPRRRTGQDVAKNIRGTAEKLIDLSGRPEVENLKLIDLPDTWEPQRDPSKMIKAASLGNLGGTQIGSLGKYSSVYRF